MALILAVNPGNRHSPTLARLARELRGCELMGAESCPVAIKAIKKRAPDVLLLPAVPAKGEADLMAHLKSIPGGVLTLKMPPVESADPVDLARQIRELLTGAPAYTPSAPPSVEAPQRLSAPTPRPTPAPPLPAAGTSPQLIAAAAATVRWIRARQAQWSEAASSAADVPQPHDDFYEPMAPPDEPQDTSLLADIEPEESARRNVTALLPRIAALAALVGIVATAIIYWPQSRGSSDNAVQASPQASEPAAASPEPVASLPSETTIGVTSNEPAEVLIDGVRAGQTPYQGKVGLGTHTVTVKTAGAERQLAVEATSKPVQLEVDFSKP